MAKSKDGDCAYDTICDETATNYCQGCGNTFCMDHHRKHGKKIRKSLKNLKESSNLLNQELNSILSKMEKEDVLDLIKPIYEFLMILDDIENRAMTIQKQLQDLFNDDEQKMKKQFINEQNQIKSHQEIFLEDDIRQLKKNVKVLKLKLIKIGNYNVENISEESFTDYDRLTNSETLPEGKLFSSLNRDSSTTEYRIERYDDEIQTYETTAASYRHGFPRHSLNIHPNQNKYNENVDEDDDEEMVDPITFDRTRKMNSKIRFSNNIVGWLRGPLRLMVTGALQIIEVCAGTKASAAVVQAVADGFLRQQLNGCKEYSNNNLYKPAFAKITSDWTFERKNPDQGFSSSSIWMRNPQGQRILVKTQDHPLCAANEWLTYVLGRMLGLPVNEVQIAIYEQNLVTLHTDVAQENERTVTFLDLPKRIKNLLITNPIMKHMEIFDLIIQNVDRNPRNILITIENNKKFDDNVRNIKMHLIDHSFCFGMGKLNGISIVASKIHSKHLAVVKFNPIDQARKFEKNLNKLSISDLNLIRNKLTRFSSITNKQFDNWMFEIYDLLTPSQYERIIDVLYRQRDITKRYLNGENIHPRSSTVNAIRESQIRRTVSLEDIRTS